MFAAFTGSPFTVKVTGEGRIKESITRKRQASSLASVGSTCGLNLKIPGKEHKIIFPAYKSASNLTLPASSLPLELNPSILFHQGTGSRWFRLRRG